MPKTNLFFKGIPKDTPDHEVQEFFAKYGEIISLKIMKPVKKPDEEGVGQTDTILNLGFGFVSYATQDSANKAKIEGVNNLFRGVRLSIKWFVPKSIRDAHKEEDMDIKNYQEHLRIKKAKESEQTVKSIVEKLQQSPDTLSSFIIPFTSLMSQTVVGQNLLSLIRMCIFPQQAPQSMPYQRRPPQQPRP